MNFEITFEVKRIDIHVVEGHQRLIVSSDVFPVVENDDDDDE